MAFSGNMVDQQWEGFNTQSGSQLEVQGLQFSGNQNTEVRKINIFLRIKLFVCTLDLTFYLICSTFFFRRKVPK